MNIGNVMNPILTEGKNQNIALGKLGIQAMQSNQMALHSNQCVDSEVEGNLGQSLFKQLLLSNPNLKAALLKVNQAKQGNVGKTGETIGEVAVDDDTETATDGKDSCQVMSSMDINMILNNGNLNKINLTQIETANGTRKQTSIPIVATKMVQPGNQASKSIFVGEAETVISASKAGKGISAGQAETIAPDVKTAELEKKQLNQGIAEKQEMLAGTKEKIEEKSVGSENSETISSINKPGNNVIDQIQVNIKNEKLENVPVYNQITEEIAAKLEQKGPMEFKLQLKPENLGEIDISIKIVEGKLSIDILSASSKTQDLLVSQVDKLVAKLGLQNFQIEHVQVNPSTTAGTLNHESASQAAMLNMGMNFSDRRHQESLKEQSIFKKDFKGISGLTLDGKEPNNSNEVLRGKEFTKHKINYAI